jgi:hypothetical protein
MGGPRDDNREGICSKGMPLREGEDLPGSRPSGQHSLSKIAPGDFVEQFESALRAHFLSAIGRSRWRSQRDMREPVPGSRPSWLTMKGRPAGVQNCSRQFCRTLYEGSHSSGSGSFASLKMALPEGYARARPWIAPFGPAVAVQNRSRRFCRTVRIGSVSALLERRWPLKMALPEGFEPSYQP